MERNYMQESNEILQIRHTVMKMKNISDRYVNKFNMSKKRIWELQDK